MKEELFMRFSFIEHESAYDTIKDTLTGEEYTVVSPQSRKLWNLLNDLDNGKENKG